MLSIDVLLKHSQQLHILPKTMSLICYWTYMGQVKPFTSVKINEIKFELEQLMFLHLFIGRNV